MVNRPQGSQFVPFIQGLRGVAIAAVVLAHAGIEAINGGFIGVDIFFVLSGYLITGLLVNEVERTGSINFLRFYARRLKRLFPALAVMVIVVSILLLTLMSPLYQAEQHGAALSAIAWVSNLYFAFSARNYFSPNQEENVFLHTWSLGVEEQFYLFWPLFIVFALGVWTQKHKSDGRKRLFTLLLLTTILGFFFSTIITVLNPEWGFYLPVSRVWQFAMGGLVFLGVTSRLSYSSSGPRKPERLVLGCLAWLGLFILIVGLVLIDPDKAYPGWWALLPTFGTAFLIFSLGVLEKHPIDFVLRFKPIQFLGNVSYSIYLWHWPVLVIGKSINPTGSVIYTYLLIALGGVLASVSYLFVENPIRYSKKLSSKNREVIAGSAVCLLALLAIGGMWGDRISKWRESGVVVEFEHSIGDVPKIYGMQCDPPIRSDEIKVCSFGDEKAGKTAVLLGDSIAGQWFPTFESIFTNAGWRFLVVTKSACPIIDQRHTYFRIKREFTECASWRRKALEYIDQLSPDLVLTSSSRTYPFDEAAWKSAGGRIHQALSLSVKNLIVIAPTPVLDSSGPLCLARNVSVPEIFADDCSVPFSGQKQIDAALRHSVETIENAYFIDFNDEICPGGFCNARQGRNIVFRDHQHLTASYARLLEPAARQLLSSLSIAGVTELSSTQTTP